MNNRLRFVELILLLVDVLCIFTGQAIGVIIWHGFDAEKARNSSTNWFELWWGHPFSLPLWIVALLMLIWMWKNALYNPYRYTTSREMAAGVSRSGAALLITIICLDFMLPTRRYARSLVVLVCLICTGTTLLGRLLFFRFQRHANIPLPKQRFCIVGLADESEHLAQLLCGRWPHVAYCGRLNITEHHSPSLGHVDDLGEIINVHNIDTLVLGAQELSRSQVMSLVTTAEHMGIRVLQLPIVWGLAEPHVTLRPLGKLALIDLSPKDYSSLDTQLKRTLDLFICLVGGLVISPLLVLVGILIYIQDRGPIFFVQPRTGKGGRSFPFFKFRTMVVDAENKRAGLLPQNESDGPLFKLKEDPRITQIGLWLRKSSIDELPQIWNVIRGDMNLVGPRPLPLTDLKAIEGNPEAEYWYEQRVKVKPGITGLWQISGRSTLGFNEMIRHDMEYIRSWSLWMDVVILAKTIPAVLRRRGAY